MGLASFSAEDVLILAVHMEEIAADFYRQAAKKSDDSKVKETFEFLARQEDAHARHYADLRKMFRNQKPLENQYDPQDEEIVKDFLATYLNEEVLDLTKNRVNKVLADGSEEDVLRLALELEKDTISFYSAFRENMVDSKDRATVRKVIMDEFSHVAHLNRLLEGIRSQA